MLRQASLYRGGCEEEEAVETGGRLGSVGVVREEAWSLGGETGERGGGGAAMEGAAKVAPSATAALPDIAEVTLPPSVVTVAGLLELLLAIAGNLRWR